jgi:TM2 domain-containing membrane protein YozV
MQTSWQRRIRPLRRRAGRPVIMEITMGQRVKDPGLASVLSLVVPGVGQFYNGDFLRGLFWLIVTPGLWIGSGGLLGWICHVIAAITAHRRANWRNRVVA